MIRQSFLHRILERREACDIAIVGGGATGVGIAVDAASRGYSVVLLEQSDFGKGTSSRSTKLVHGGVRYLQQGNVSLVMEALKERGILFQNAPALKFTICSRENMALAGRGCSPARRCWSGSRR
jgi:glycerol-3-phosphate dehydrogenase